MKTLLIALLVLSTSCSSGSKKHNHENHHENKPMNADQIAQQSEPVHFVVFLTKKGRVMCHLATIDETSENFARKVYKKYPKKFDTLGDCNESEEFAEAEELRDIRDLRYNDEEWE